MAKRIDYKAWIGNRYGRLVVVGMTECQSRATDRRPWWMCRCDCGNLFAAICRDVRSGNTKSCGCLRKDHPNSMTHGHSPRSGWSGTYKSWSLMMDRCRNPVCPHFSNYGGRGIRVCERWHSFENFLADMGDRPPKMSIDRIDNERGYEPGNCRWATVAEQSRNRRNVIMFEHNGQRLCVAEWEREWGFPRDRVTDRLRHGWTIEEALELAPKTSAHGKIKRLRGSVVRE